MKYEKDNGWLGGLKEALNAVEDLPSAQTERKWIPVTEALPEEDLDVLVTVRFDGNKDVPPSVYVETGCYMDDNWISDSDEYKVSPRRHHVIAWMLLPEPWKEGE